MMRMENGHYLSHRVERQSDVFLDRWFRRERTLLLPQFCREISQNYQLNNNTEIAPYENITNRTHHDQGGKHGGKKNGGGT
jgi:hypothetical protein